MGYTVCCQGTVSTTEPWLSASPDGIMNGDTILEIKCPLLQGQEQFHKKLKTDGLCDVGVIGGKDGFAEKGAQRLLYAGSADHVLHRPQTECGFFSCGRTKDMCWWRLHMTSPMCMMFSSG